MKLMLLGSLVAGLVLASNAPAKPSASRACGYLSVGKGWHVRATRNVSCVGARRVVRNFFALPRCLPAQRDPTKACLVGGFRCTEGYGGGDMGLVRCRRPGRLVSARSNQ